MQAERLILLSGGADSATALALASQKEASLSTLFVDYGQAAARAENLAAKTIAEAYRANHSRLTFHGLHFGSGEVKARNAFLVHVALLAVQFEVGVVIIAIHAGTPYRDCGPAFLELMQRSFDFHTDGAIGLEAPFIHFKKQELFRLALELGVPIDLTYSCESADRPCSKCLSCLDREALVASA